MHHRSPHTPWYGRVFWGPFYPGRRPASIFFFSLVDFGMFRIVKFWLGFASERRPHTRISPGKPLDSGTEGTRGLCLVGTIHNPPICVCVYVCHKISVGNFVVAVTIVAVTDLFLILPIWQEGTEESTFALAFSFVTTTPLKWNHW